MQHVLTTSEGRRKGSCQKRSWFSCGSAGTTQRWISSAASSQTTRIYFILSTWTRCFGFLTLPRRMDPAAATNTNVELPPVLARIQCLVCTKETDLPFTPVHGGEINLGEVSVAVDGCTEDIQVRCWSWSHLTLFSCPGQPAACNVHPVTGHLPLLLPGDSWHLLGSRDSLRRKNSVWQQPGAMGGEKILLHLRQDAKLRFHSLLSCGLSNDLHLCMVYGMQTCPGHGGGAGEGQVWLWEGSGRLCWSEPDLQVWDQCCTKLGCLTCFPSANNSTKPVPDLALPGQPQKAVGGRKRSINSDLSKAPQSWNKQFRRECGLFLFPQLFKLCCILDARLSRIWRHSQGEHHCPFRCFCVTERPPSTSR